VSLAVWPGGDGQVGDMLGDVYARGHHLFALIVPQQIRRDSLLKVANWVYSFHVFLVE